MLAANRIPKLKALAKYDKNSIATNNGTKTNGVPDGANTAKNFNPYFSNPIIVTPIIIAILKLKVNAKWAVAEKPYGIKPTKFENNIKLNNPNIYGKYISFSFPIWSFTIDNTDL